MMNNGHILRVRLANNMRINAMNITSDNEATRLNWTEYLAESDCYDLHISVSPETNMDGIFTAFCHDEQEMIKVTGWLFSFQPIANK